MPEQIENKTAHNPAWDDYMSNPQPEPKGFYNRRRELFVGENKALEHAVDSIQSDGFERERFLEDFVELVYGNPAVKEKFLVWFYSKWERKGD